MTGTGLQLHLKSGSLSPVYIGETFALPQFE